MSDGSTTQYRNRTRFYLISKYLPSCYPQVETITYNFSEAGHEESAPDGISGLLRRVADIYNITSVISIVQKKLKNICIPILLQDIVKEIDTRYNTG